MSLPDSVHALERDLRGVFGSRLRSLVAYGLRPATADHDHHGHSHGHGHSHDPSDPIRTLALVESLTGTDLRGCAAKVPSWHAAGLATPLLVAATEFEQSLDAFPLEFGAIIADHEVVSGSEPFAQSRVEAADLRRAVEVQARSHLLHLREGYLEAQGNSHALAVLIVASAAPLAVLLASVARLEGRAGSDAAGAARHTERALGITSGLAEIVALEKAREIPGAAAERLFPTYLDAVEKLVAYVDGWSTLGQ